MHDLERCFMNICIRIWERQWHCNKPAFYHRHAIIKICACIVEKKLNSNEPNDSGEWQEICIILISLINIYIYEYYVMIIIWIAIILSVKEFFLFRVAKENSFYQKSNANLCALGSLCASFFFCCPAFLTLLPLIWPLERRCGFVGSRNWRW